MAQPLPHLALKTNLDPDTHSVSVQNTYNLAMDDPANFMGGRRLLTTQVLDQPVPNFIVSPAVRTNSPEDYLTKGKGLRWQFDIEVRVMTGNPPASLANTYENEFGFDERQMVKLAGELAIGMSGINDGVSRYLWMSTNYRWNNPAEAWFPVKPAPNSVKIQYDQAHGVKVRKMTMTLLTRHYKSISQTNYRRGAEDPYAGAGTLTTTLISTAVTGVGTAFLTDFIHGDYLLDNTGAIVGTVDTVASNTSMALKANAAIALTGAAYKVRQRSNMMTSVPIYTFTSF